MDGTALQAPPWLPGNGGARHLPVAAGRGKEGLGNEFPRTPFFFSASLASASQTEGGHSKIFIMGHAG